MEALIEKLGWKKFAAAVVIVCLLFLGYVIYSFMNETTVKKPTEKALESGRSGSMPIIPTPAQRFKGDPVITEKVIMPKTEKATSFEFKYPVDWSKEAKKNDKVIFLKRNLKGQGGIPEAQIQITVFDTQSAEIIINTFKNRFGYKDSPIQVGSRKGRLLYGSPKALPYLKEKIVVVENKGKVYQILLSYRSNQLNIPIEDSFNTVISTFRFY